VSRRNGVERSANIFGTSNEFTGLSSRRRSRRGRANKFEKQHDVQSSTEADARSLKYEAHDHNYVLKKNAGSARPGGGLIDPKSSSGMESATEAAELQLYTANHLEHAAVCLETEPFPVLVRKPKFSSTILRPGERFQATTVSRISVR
jgi:galactose mutarotase-like enzyme